MEHDLKKRSSFNWFSTIATNPISPMVATTLKSPLAIRSVSSSIAWSEDEGEFKTVYAVCGRAGAVVPF